MSRLTRTELQRIFEKLDLNSDGLVSLDELNWLLERIGYHLSPEELETLAGKTSLDFDDFLLLHDSLSQQEEEGGETKEGTSSDHGIQDQERDLVNAFKVFDLDGDGFITSQELQCVLKRLELWDEKNGKDCKSMICVYDTNSDGQLDFEEFKNMMLLTIS